MLSIHAYAFVWLESRAFVALDNVLAWWDMAVGATAGGSWTMSGHLQGGVQGNGTTLRLKQLLLSSK